MYEEVGGIVSGGKAAEQNGSSRISLLKSTTMTKKMKVTKRMKAMVVNTPPSRIAMIMSAKFQGESPGCVQERSGGLGYYWTRCNNQL